MAETESQAPPPAAPAFAPSAPRSAPKTGMPTEGFLVFAGLPKAGKTALLASVPGAVILELEKGGADRLSGWVQEIPDLATFRQALKWAIKDPAVKVIGVDTIDAIIDWLEDDVLAVHGMTSMSERKDGVNAWSELRKRVNAMVGLFKTCGKPVIGLAHYKEPKLDNEGRLVITQSVNAPGKIGPYLCAQADLIGNCSKSKMGNAMQYTVSFVGGGVIGAYGSRVAELEGKTIVLPKGKQWAAIAAACVEAAVEAAAPAAAPTAAPVQPAPKKIAPINGTAKARAIKPQAQKQEAAAAGGK